MKKYKNGYPGALFLMILSAFLSSCNQTKVAPPAAAGPVPDERQMGWHEMEQNAFIHFTINTFTDKEWGYGDESPALFNPTGLDPDQWVSVLKETGFKGLILTCKHHDGFSLWPTAYSDHSIKNSPRCCSSATPAPICAGAGTNAA